MTTHAHVFEPAVIIPMARGAYNAWVPWRATNAPAPTKHAWLCRCGEQGYEVRR